MEKILEVKNLNVKFGREKIIENLSFDLEEGEVLTIVGPNGAGKTTLIRALLGIIGYSGKIEWKKGIKINYLPERLSREGFSKIPISIRDFFGIKEVSEKKVIDTLKLVGLNKKILDRNPSNLSSGQFQRMLIAWSIVDDPNVLLLDEPNTGIDISGKETIFSLLDRILEKKKMTMVIVTHDLDIVYAYSTNVLCLHKKTICYGKPRSILTSENLKKLYGSNIKFYKHTHRW